MTSATGSQGFTLLELLVVLAILVLLAGSWGLAAPRMFPAQQLRDEAQQLLASLRATRTLARASGIVQIMDLNHDGYRSVTETHALPKGVALNWPGASAGTNRPHMTFYPDGAASGGVLELSLNQRTERVAVGTVTGRAELLK